MFMDIRKIIYILINLLLLELSFLHFLFHGLIKETVIMQKMPSDLLVPITDYLPFGLLTYKQEKMSIILYFNLDYWQ